MAKRKDEAFCERASRNLLATRKLLATMSFRLVKNPFQNTFWRYFLAIVYNVEQILGINLLSINWEPRV